MTAIHNANDLEDSGEKLGPGVTKYDSDSAYPGLTFSQRFPNVSKIWLFHFHASLAN